jgi:hypothetical protein
LQASSGSDVFIAKAASQKKTIQQSYLCLLPGNLQLNVPTDKKTEMPSQDDASDQDDDQVAENSDNDNNKSETKKQKATNTTQLTTLGRMENFSTHPVLSLAVNSVTNAAQGSTLQFTGQHVASTSKFLLVSFQPKKKKQRVTVKHVFHSVVVFGTGTLIGPAVGESLAVDNEGTAVLPIQTELDHYGGSGRARNAGASGKWITSSTKKLLPRRLSASTKQAGSEEEDDDDDESSMDEFHASSPSPTVATRTSLSRQTKSNRKRMADSDDHDDEVSSNGSVDSDCGDEESDASITSKSAGRAKLSKKIVKGAKKINDKASARSAQRKSDHSESTDSGAIELTVSSDSDDDSSLTFGAKKSTSARREATRIPVQNSSSVQHAKKVPVQKSAASNDKTGRNNKTPVQRKSTSTTRKRSSLDNSESDSDNGNLDVNVPLLSTKNRPRRSTTKRNAKNCSGSTDESDDVESELDEDSVTDGTPKTKGPKASNKQRTNQRSDKVNIDSDGSSVLVLVVGSTRKNAVDDESEWSNDE